MSIPGAASPLFLTSAAAAADDAAAFKVNRSVRFNDEENAHMVRTPSSAGDVDKWTWSGWVKRSGLGSHTDFFSAVQSGSNATIIQFDNNDKLDFENFVGNADKGRRITTQVFRDVSAWYHIVVVYDSGNSTADDRIILYVNGSRITSFSYTTNPDSGQNSIVNSTYPHYLGSDKGFNNHYFDGYLADVHLVDGQALAPTDFGSFDANNNWNPKDYTGTYGTNGFHLNFSDNSANAALGFDQKTAAPELNPKGGFDVLLYTGDGGSSQTISGLAFQPDFVWFKARTETHNHAVFDVVRGVERRIHPSKTQAEDASSSGLKAFNSDGFTVGANNVNGKNGVNYVAWCWKAGGAAVANTDGSISSQVSASAEYGFSVVTYTGTGSNATVGHGLSSAPKWIVVKDRSQATGWSVYHDAIGTSSANYIELQSTGLAAQDNTAFQNTAPTDSVFSIGTKAAVNESGDDFVAYCWSEVSGFSKFGSYTGSGSTAQTITTGFSPAFVILRDTTQQANWVVLDSKRGSSWLEADGTATENSNSNQQITFGDDGFTVSGGKFNADGKNTIYMAFAGLPGNHFEPNNLVATAGADGTLGRAVSLYTGNDATQKKIGGVVYSKAVPTADGFRPGRAAADGFDGSLSTYVALNNYTFNLDVGSWGLSGTLEVYTGANMQYAVDGGSASSMTADGWTNVGNANAITTLTFTRTDGAYPYFYAIRLDGEYLIDGDGGPALQFQPDLVWVKNRDQTEKHVLVDSVRGVDKALYSSSASAEDSGSTYSDRFVSFNSDGFNVGSTHTTTNSDGDDFAAWSWSAGPNSNKTYTVKVVSDSGNKYRFDDFGSSAVTLDLQEGSTYIFDQSDSSNSGHPIRFGTSANGTDYTTGVTHTGTPGSAGAKTTLVLGTGVATLYYSCANHSGMGGQINTNSTAGASNFDGSIQAVVKASDTHGFSIMRYLGNATSNATVGHGLSKAPEWIIGKNRGGGDAWWVWFKAHSSNASKFLRLNLTNTESDTQYIANDTAPSSSVVTLGSDYGWNSNQSPGMIMYAWTSVSGYSKFGTYTGASNLEITTGFKVQWLLLKSYAGDGFNWVIIDNARAANSSGVSKKLYPNLNGSEDSDSRASETKVEFTDTGFKFLDTGAETNSSSRSYVYAAFAGKPPSNIIDSMVDSPSNYAADSGHNGGNYPTVNRVAAANISSTEEGNLKVTTQSSNYGPVVTTMATSGSGKWYAEITWNSGTHSEFGLVPASSKIVGQGHLHDLANSYVLDSYAGQIRYNGGSGSSASVSSGDVVRIAFDESASQVEFFVNGASVGTLTASSSTAGVPYVFGVSDRDSGSASTYTFNFGASGSFDFDPPIGYSNLCTQNLPDPTIADGSAHFEAKTFTGTGSSQTISGLQFSPDFVWIKNRADSSAAEHRLLDTVRGATKVLYSNLTNSESAESQSLTAFTSDGFTVGTGNYVNGSGDGMIAWAWDAGSSTAVNQDGDINSNVRVNASAGCSIVTFSTGLDGVKAIGHGLNATPTFVITKQRNATSNWIVYHEGGTGYDQIIRLNLNSGLVSLSSAWGSASNWSNATFGINTSTNQTGDVVAYCFAPVTGFSSFGTYEGNGSNDGPAVILSFRPSWVMIKRLGEGDWRIWDTSRDPSNFADNKLYPNKTDAETGSSDTNEIDILSNGFKLRSSASEGNASSNTYIYAAFAEHPFKTARAR